MSSSSTPALLLNTNNTGTTGLSDSKAVTTVVLHPMVLLSILDHHTRRQDGELRVIGTLLGKRDGDKVRSFFVLFSNLGHFFYFHRLFWFHISLYKSYIFKLLPIF